MNASNTSPPRSTRETVVQEADHTASDVVQSKNVEANDDDSRAVDETIPLREPRRDSKNVTTEEENSQRPDGEVRFVVPERQQTAEEFDVRQFRLDVEQLAAGLQAVARRQAEEDFEPDRLQVGPLPYTGTIRYITFYTAISQNLTQESAKNRPHWGRNMNKSSPKYFGKSRSSGGYAISVGLCL